jgi:hypothetical protein
MFLGTSGGGGGGGARFVPPIVRSTSRGINSNFCHRSKNKPDKNRHTTACTAVRHGRMSAPQCFRDNFAAIAETKM